MVLGMNSNTPPAFKMLFGTEVLSDTVTAKGHADLVMSLLAISLCFGIARTERAIKNTYTLAGAKQVIANFNTALKLIAA
jgi:hypothetical protein